MNEHETSVEQRLLHRSYPLDLLRFVPPYTPTGR